MKSVIFSVTVKYLKYALLAVSIWLFLRGHNLPGGGFVAGLVAASAVLLVVLDRGWEALPLSFRDNLFPLTGLGLLISVLSGALALAIDNPFMTGRWLTIRGVEIGTPIMFDLGVMIVVFAVVIICIGHLLAEDEEGAI